MMSQTGCSMVNISIAPRCNESRRTCKFIDVNGQHITEDNDLLCLENIANEEY